MRVHVYAIAKQPGQIYTFWTGLNKAISAYSWVLAAVARALSSAEPEGLSQHSVQQPLALHL